MQWLPSCRHIRDTPSKCRGITCTPGKVSSLGEVSCSPDGVLVWGMVGPRQTRIKSYIAYTIPPAFPDYPPLLPPPPYVILPVPKSERKYGYPKKGVNHGTWGR